MIRALQETGMLTTAQKLTLLQHAGIEVPIPARAGFGGQLDQPDDKVWRSQASTQTVRWMVQRHRRCSSKPCSMRTACGVRPEHLGQCLAPRSRVARSHRWCGRVSGQAQHALRSQHRRLAANSASMRRHCGLVICLRRGNKPFGYCRSAHGHRLGDLNGSRTYGVWLSRTRGDPA